jgi:hypothetical protein
VAASFMCWEPSLDINPSSPSFAQQLRSAQASKAPPSEKMLAFVARLAARYPELPPTDETPWAAGPLTREISGNFIHFVVKWSWYKGTLIAFVAEAGQSLGLQCYDSQSGILYEAPRNKRAPI